MEPKIIMESGKAFFELLKAVVDFVSDNKLATSEKERLLSFYLAIQGYAEVKKDYFLFIENLSNLEEDHTTILWQAKKLSTLMAARHFDAYRLSDGLDFQIRAHEHSLHDLLRVYKTRVSRSLGFGPKDVAIASAYKSIAGQNLKRKHFNATYKISFEHGTYLIGNIKVGNNSTYQDFVKLHKQSDKFIEVMIGELDSAVEKHVNAKRSHVK